jgi:TonB family protein
MGPAQGQVSSELEQARAAPEFGAHTPLSEKLLAVAIRAQNFTGSTGVAIALTEGDEIVCRANWGTSAPEVGAKLSLENSFTGLCMRTGEPLRCNDAQSDPRVDPEACQALGISAIAAAPVRRGLKVVGVIAAFSDTPNAFTDKHLLILTTLADVVVELLDDPHPVQPMPQAAETEVPEMAGAASVVQASVAKGDQASASTTVAEESTAPPAPEDPVVAFMSLPAVTASDPPVGATPFAAATSMGAPKAPSVAASEPADSSQAGPAAPQRSSMDRFQAPTSKEEVLPAAMDPGPVQRQGKAGDTAPPRLTLVKPSQASPAAVPDFIADLKLSEVEADADTLPRWLLPAAILAIFAILAFAAWRVHAARSASKAPPVATAPAPPVAAAQATQPGQEEQQNAPSAGETQHSPFSTPQIAETVPAPAKAVPAAAKATPPAAKAAPPADEPGDVTVRKGPQPVVEIPGPVRHPPAPSASRKAQVAEAQAPQLALAAPDLPPALAQPTGTDVVGPASRFVPARLIHRIEPVYPQAARRLQLSGRVVVKATVTKKGTVADVQWESGSEIFRDSVVAAVKQWRYQPASLDSQPVESDLEIVLHFNRTQ